MSRNASVQNDMPPLLPDDAAEVDLKENKSVLHTDPVASVQTTAINIISNVVGAGILSIPAAVASMSVIPGLIVLIIFAILSSYSMLLLTICAQRTGRFTYKDLIEFAFKSSAYGRAFDGAIFIYTFACCIAYAKAVGDSMSPVMTYLVGHETVATGHGFWILMAAFIFFPLSSLKQLSELKISSLFGFLVIVYMVFVVVINFFQNESPTGTRVNTTTPWFDLGTDFLRSAPICSVAFSCHYNVPVFFGEMKRRRPSKMIRAVSFAVPVIFTIYVVTAVFSVLHFNKHDLTKQGDISLNFPDSYMPMTIGRIGLFIHFVCVFPIICIASRRAFNSIVFNRGNMSRIVYAAEALCLVALACVLAWQAQSVTEVFQFNGALFGISIVVVIPNVLYLKIVPPADSLQAVNGDEDNEEKSVPELVGSHSPRDDDDGGDVDEEARLEVPPPGSFGARVDALVLSRSPAMSMLARVFVVFGLVLSIAAFTIDIVNLATKKHESPAAAPAAPSNHTNATTFAPRILGLTAPLA